jgi:hypothetical protein
VHRLSGAEENRRGEGLGAGVSSRRHAACSAERPTARRAGVWGILARVGGSRWPVLPSEEIFLLLTKKSTKPEFIELIRVKPVYWSYLSSWILCS